MLKSRQSKKGVMQQAIRWYLWLREQKVEPATVEVFQKWCNSNAKHKEAYQKIEQLWQVCDSVDAQYLPWPTLLELQQDLYDGSQPLPMPGSVAEQEQQTTAPASSGEFVLARGQQAKSKRFKSLHWGIAASVFVVAILSSYIVPRVYEQFNPFAELVYVTGVGQQLSETLEDGSKITLGGSSQLSVSYSEDKRLVVLDRGEAFFEVAKDSTRPFAVAVGSREVVAVGTVFNINRRQAAVTVSVVEGIVDVSDTVNNESASIAASQEPSIRKERLRRGQELVFNRSGDVWQSHQPESLERATAWRDGRLAYVNARLESVIEDVNRYTSRRLVIAEQELAERRYTGTVFSNDIQGWLKALENTFALDVITIDDNIVLVPQSTTQNNLQQASAG